MLTPQRYQCRNTVCGQKSIKTGLRYEARVCEDIAQTFPGQFVFQAKIGNGIADALYLPGSQRSVRFSENTDLPEHPIIVEVKLTQTADAYYQAARYMHGLFEKHSLPPAARVIITKTVVLTISTPEAPTYLRSIRDLISTQPAGYYIIPHQGKIL